MIYIFVRSEDNLYTVGAHSEGDNHVKFYPLVDVPTQEMALMWIHWLNGGRDPLAMPPRSHGSAGVGTQARAAIAKAGGK